MRKPSALPLDRYEEKLNQFIGNYCHRRLNAGWKMDKTVRDAGPFIATLTAGKYSGTDYATHAPVLIWYSPEMVEWLRKNRGAKPAVHPAPVPDGAIMIKEMYGPPPAANCQVPDLLKLKPQDNGAAIMIRDSKAAADGWFWGWYGWPGYGWTVDYPPPKSNTPPNMGFGQYCLNCHASARDNQTFASLSNIKGEPGTPLTFLVQDFFQTQSFGVQSVPAPAAPGSTNVPVHMKAVQAMHLAASPPPMTVDVTAMDFMAALKLAPTPAPEPGALNMPSQSYDNVWVSGRGAPADHAFITSTQCVGCHTAGGTGLQYEMTAPVPGAATEDAALYNFSPYGTWRTSPMGLAGRDPIFFSQLASETQTFHPQQSPLLQSTCLGCHGIGGQRQFEIDRASGDQCPDFLRSMVDAVPFPADNPNAGLAHFGALSRDGVTCAACHHMVLSQKDNAVVAGQPQNRCVAQRQALLNAENTGFARTFSGSFLLGSPDTFYGPFPDPKQVPMSHAIGGMPVEHTDIKSSELCGTCHAVHLPVFAGTKEVATSYEQTTYPEWAFSAYRTGSTPDGKLPFGPGALAKSCQDCHMQNAADDGKPFRSKIAAIQEHSNFPQVDYGLGSEIDLPVRTGFAKHTLVGLNVFLVEIARQFDAILGITKLDPMMGTYGVPPLDLTEQAMLEQASRGTATIRVTDTALSATELVTKVAVTNETGHKFPSGVGFRRAFIDFAVLDASGAVLWESGRTTPQGLITGPDGKAIAGELWWKDDCSGQINQPGDNHYQPHHTEIARQDQAQIFQELVTAPAPDAPALCGREAPAGGALTTSFLSVCGTLKDNRLLPKGFLPLEQRVSISTALGAGADMAIDAGPFGTADDPAYVSGGGDALSYRVKLSGLSGTPASVQATLYYQAMPPFFLQDRFCTAKGTDVERLRYVTESLKLTGTRAANWKLNMVSTGPVAVK